MNEPILKQLGITQTQIAERLNLTGGAVSLKVNGHRPWKRDEIDAVLALCRERNPDITYEQLFGAVTPEEELAAPEPSGAVA